MTSLHDPLHLPSGLVLPNRIMKAAMSEALADSGNSPGARLERLSRTWSKGGSDPRTLAALRELDARSRAEL
jgi:2,4-dienoyl-CoA reductase-like NADH-dependent reductase (Old Yellow Enzyme family)